MHRSTKLKFMYLHLVSSFMSVPLLLFPSHAFRSVTRTTLNGKYMLSFPVSHTELHSLSDPSLPASSQRGCYICSEQAGVHFTLVFSSETLFAISYNKKSWNNNFLTIIHEVSLCDIKVGTWCAASATRNTGPLLVAHFKEQNTQ